MAMNLRAREPTLSPCWTHVGRAMRSSCPAAHQTAPDSTRLRHHRTGARRICDTQDSSLEQSVELYWAMVPLEPSPTTDTGPCQRAALNPIGPHSSTQICM